MSLEHLTLEEVVGHLSTGSTFLDGRLVERLTGAFNRTCRELKHASGTTDDIVCPPAWKCKWMGKKYHLPREHVEEFLAKELIGALRYLQEGLKKSLENAIAQVQACESHISQLNTLERHFQERSR